MEEILYRYNPWWEEGHVFESIIERPCLLERIKHYEQSRHVVFLTGLRRVGKTTLLKLLIKHFIENLHIKPGHIFYISLDDYQLSKKTILELVEEYRAIQRLSYKQKVILFFDEIAYQKDFELQLKNLYDNQDVKIYASSSSASILKSKKPYLTGRSAIVEVLPLNFSEYLTFKQIKISKADKHLKKQYFEDFLQTGGLPEYVLRGDIEYLKELVDDIIYKDITAFHNIKNQQVLKDFFLLLMERAGKAVSINKIARILKISPDTAKRYLKMFADTYLIYLVSRCGRTNEKILSPKKVYAADLGIRTFFTGFRDIGSLFENYAYLEIRHLKPCYIYEDGYEIDFLTEDKTLIEVKYYNAMPEKQKKLFDRFAAKKKIIIKDIDELERITPKPAVKQKK
ncbi:MAG: ATP-binding protein [Nitrospirae bacterium]|nr:ATP-binding protein [Nitrospirota bacterium]